MREEKRNPPGTDDGPLVAVGRWGRSCRVKRDQERVLEVSVVTVQPPL